MHCVWRPWILTLRVILVLGVMAAASVAQAVTFTAFPSACTNVTGVGSRAWSNPSRARTTDASYATAALSSGNNSNYLQCTNYGFAIPATATITGIRVNVTRKIGSGGARDLDVLIIKGGTVSTAVDRATTTAYTTSDVNEDHGGSADLWGLSWTVADINAADFGVAFAAQRTSGSPTVSVDSISITVAYTLPCTPPSNTPADVTLTCVCDNFNRATLNPSTIFNSNWVVSTSDSTGVVPSIVDNGFLRLTENTGNNAKAATVPGIFPAAANYISVEFQPYAYSGSGADGMAVTLSDYSVPPVPGAFGGSLGYAQKTGINGFAGGWIGVALDEFGNYQNPTEGRVGGPGSLPETVAVRGSGSGTTGYPWLQGNTSALSPAIDNPASTVPAPDILYQVIVDARNAASATPQTLIAVNRDTTGTSTSYSSVIPSFDAFARATALGYTQAAVPANWQISFTGSTGGSTNIHELGSLRICAQTVAPTSGGVATGFSAIDEAYGTPPSVAVQNYLTGTIYTKLVNTAFKLNIAALNNNQIQTTYAAGSNKSVTVKLVDNSDGACVLNSAQANYCSAACKAKSAVAGGTQTLTYAASNAGQQQTAAFTLTAPYKNLAVLVGDGTTTACSTDAFSVRPLSFTGVSTSGVGTTANNTALTGAPSFRAGTDAFVLTAATGLAGYTGTPKINTTGMSADGTGWVVGAFTPSAFSGADTATGAASTSFVYGEVGHFSFRGVAPCVTAGNPSGCSDTSVRGIYDNDWTAVDSGATGDCVAGSYSNTKSASGKYGCLFGLQSNSGNFGRFRPDHYTVVSGSVVSSCTAGANSFTYMGQSAMNVAFVVEARNGSNAITTNYSNSAAMTPVYPVGAPTLVAEDQAGANLGCDLGSRISALPSVKWIGGSYTVASTATSFSRPTGVPAALDISTAATCAANSAQVAGPFWNLDVGVRLVDADGVGLNTSGTNGADMNASSSTACSGSGCDARKIGTTAQILGRLHLFNAYGSELLPILVPVRAEYFNAGVWTLNSNDACTALSAGSVALGNATPAYGSSLAVSAPPTGVAVVPSTTLTGGVASVRITPSAKGAGSVDLALNLGNGVTGSNWCGTWAAAPSGGATPSPDLSYLSGNWCGTASDRVPNARIRFGASKAPYIYLRERY